MIAAWVSYLYYIFFCDQHIVDLLFCSLGFVDNRGGLLRVLGGRDGGVGGQLGRRHRRGGLRGAAGAVRPEEGALAAAQVARRGAGRQEEVLEDVAHAGR